MKKPSTLQLPHLSACCLMVFALFSLTSGCAVQTDDGIMAGPAVTLSSKAKDSGTAGDQTNLPGTIAVLPLSNNTNSELAIDVIRQTLTNHFGSKNYRVLHIGEVDRRLALAGIDGSAIENLELEAIRSALGIDGLIKGSVTHFDKTFAGVGARISVGVSLQLYNEQNEVVWNADNVQRSYAGGVSASPVGIIVNALAAAKHLYGDINLYRAADDLGRALVKDMPSPAVLSGQQLPRIEDVVHSGASQALRYGDVLELALAGESGYAASVAIDSIGVVELQEVSPGQYTGKIAISPDIDIRSARVTGRLMNPEGQFSSWVSPYGLLTIDNTAPEQLANLRIQSVTGGIQLNWSLPKDDAVKVRASLVNGDSDTASVEIQSLDLRGLTNFEPAQLSIVTADAAGNESPEMRLTVIAAPDARFNEALDIEQSLPPVIHGVQRMRAAFGPYTINGPIRIASDGVLLIEPNTTLRLSQNAKIDVLGELNAMGSTDSPITVTQADGTVSRQFLVFNSSLPNQVSGLQVDSVQVPLQIVSGAPVIQDSTISGSFNAVMVSGSAKPSLVNNVLTGASASALVISGQAQPRLKGNRFTDNMPFHIQNSSSYAIEIGNNQFEPEASNTTILGATSNNVNYGGQ